MDFITGSWIFIFMVLENAAACETAFLGRGSVSARIAPTVKSEGGVLKVTI
jgi:hypothetical protein